MAATGVTLSCKESSYSGVSGGETPFQWHRMSLALYMLASSKDSTLRERGFCAIPQQCGQIKKIGWESKPNRGNLYIP